MKTDLSKQTKYFKNVFNHDKKDFELIEIPLNRDNWFYVQMDATIRTAFSTYNCPIPKYVVIEECRYYTSIHIFRETIKNPKELIEWNEKWLYVLSDLQHQADFNSINKEDDNENFIRYEFKLM